MNYIEGDGIFYKCFSQQIDMLANYINDNYKFVLSDI